MTRHFLRDDDITQDEQTAILDLAEQIKADRWGRKWPFIVNNVLFIILELGTGFVSTYKQFLAVRALFGIAMGGLYGNATATGEFLPILFQ